MHCYVSLLYKYLTALVEFLISIWLNVLQLCVLVKNDAKLSILVILIWRQGPVSTFLLLDENFAGVVLPERFMTPPGISYTLPSWIVISLSYVIQVSDWKNNYNFEPYSSSIFRGWGVSSLLSEVVTYGLLRFVACRSHWPNHWPSHW